MIHNKCNVLYRIDLHCKHILMSLTFSCGCEVKRSELYIRGIHKKVKKIKKKNLQNHKVIFIKSSLHFLVAFAFLNLKIFELSLLTQGNESFGFLAQKTTHGQNSYFPGSTSSALIFPNSEKQMQPGNVMSFLRK